MVEGGVEGLAAGGAGEGGGGAGRKGSGKAREVEEAGPEAVEEVLGREALGVEEAGAAALRLVGPLEPERRVEPEVDRVRAGEGGELGEAALESTWTANRRESRAVTDEPNSVKQRMVRIIEAQPEQSSFDEILRELAFAGMIERGLADADEGRTLSHEQVRRELGLTGGKREPA